MPGTLPSYARAELAALARRYGDPLARVVDLDGALFDPLDRADRYGEVCMVLRRPSGALLTAIKTFYPRGAYRLPTGGVRHGEAIEAALHREVREETGLEVAVRRFLAFVTYRRRSVVVFHTFAFLLDEVGGVLGAGPEAVAERIEEFREAAPAELPALARALRSLDGASSEIGGSWRDWGRFRAATHEIVWEALGRP